MNIVTALLLVALFVRNVEAFPIASKSKSSVRQDYHRLYSSSDDRIVDTTDSVDVPQKPLKDVVKDTEVRQDHHQLHSSSDDRIVVNDDSVDAPQKALHVAAVDTEALTDASSDDRIVDNTDNVDAPPPKAPVDDTEALSGLLGEMFQAKLEMSRENKELESLASKNSDMPTLGGDGIYRIINQKQLENFKAANADKLVFLKFSSPICAACRMLKQKFQTLHRNPKFAGAPVVFADIVISNNKRVQDPFRDYITTQLEVRRIPTIHFYAGGSGSNTDNAHVDEIYCDDEGGCSWPKIQQKMLDFVGQHYTPPPIPAHDVSSAVTAAAETIQPSTTAIATTRVATQKISKRQRIRKLFSLSWLR